MVKSEIRGVGIQLWVDRGQTSTPHPRKALLETKPFGKLAQIGSMRRDHHKLRAKEPDRGSAYFCITITQRWLQWSRDFHQNLITKYMYKLTDSVPLAHFSWLSSPAGEGGMLSSKSRSKANRVLSDYSGSRSQKNIKHFISHWWKNCSGYSVPSENLCCNTTHLLVYYFIISRAAMAEESSMKPIWHGMMTTRLKSQLTELLGHRDGVEAYLASRVIMRVVGRQDDPFGSRVLASAGSCRSNQAKVMGHHCPQNVTK